MSSSCHPATSRRQLNPKFKGPCVAVPSRRGDCWQGSSSPLMGKVTVPVPSQPGQGRRLTVVPHASFAPGVEQTVQNCAAAVAASSAFAQPIVVQAVRSGAAAVAVAIAIPTTLALPYVLIKNTTDKNQSMIGALDEVADEFIMMLFFLEVGLPGATMLPLATGVIAGAAEGAGLAPGQAWMLGVLASVGGLFARNKD